MEPGAPLSLLLPHPLLALFFVTAAGAVCSCRARHVMPNFRRKFRPTKKFRHFWCEEGDQFFLQRTRLKSYTHHTHRSHSAMDTHVVSLANLSGVCDVLVFFHVRDPTVLRRGTLILSPKVQKNHTSLRCMCGRRSVRSTPTTQ